MHTLAGFYSSVPINSTYLALAAAIDQSLTISANNKYIFAQRLKLFQAMILGANVTNARADAPSLRALVLPQIYPVIAAAAVPDQPAVSLLADAGIVFQQNEEVTFDVSHAGAGADDVFGAMWLMDQFTPAPGGPVFTLYGTSTIVHVKGAWVLGAITLDQALPQGRYSVVGMDAVSANGLLCRLVFPGLSQWRPGVVCNAVYGRRSWFDKNRFGRFGAWGDFYNTAQPQIEVFGIAAGSVQVQVVIDVVKSG